MKMKLFTIIFTSQLLFCSFSGIAKRCYAHLSIDSTIYWYIDPNTYRIEIPFDPGDSINFNVSIEEVTTQLCTCEPGFTQWSHDSIGMVGLTCNVVDTGIYYVSYNAYTISGSCLNGWGAQFFHVYYRVTTNVSEVNPLINLSVYPSPSSGIFKIKTTDRNLKQICVTDCTGQPVVSSSSNFSEIILTGFPAGIYFYAITDDKENIFRGRIVKE